MDCGRCITVDGTIRIHVIQYYFPKKGRFYEEPINYGLLTLLTGVTGGREERFKPARASCVKKRVLYCKPKGQSYC